MAARAPPGISSVTCGAEQPTITLLSLHSTHISGCDKTARPVPSVSAMKPLNPAPLHATIWTASVGAGIGSESVITAPWGSRPTIFALASFASLVSTHFPKKLLRVRWPLLLILFVILVSPLSRPEIPCRENQDEDDAKISVP